MWPGFDDLPIALKAAGSVVVTELTEGAVTCIACASDRGNNAYRNSENICSHNCLISSSIQPLSSTTGYDSQRLRDKLKIAIAAVCDALEKYGLPHATIQNILLSSAVLAQRICGTLAQGCNAFIRRGACDQPEARNHPTADVSTAETAPTGRTSVNVHGSNNDEAVDSKNESSNVEGVCWRGLPLIQQAAMVPLRLTDPLWQFLLTTYLSVCWTEDEPFPIRTLLGCLKGAADVFHSLSADCTSHLTDTWRRSSIVSLFNSDLLLAMKYLRYRLRVDVEEIAAILRSHLVSAPGVLWIPQIPQLRLFLQRMEQSVISGFEFLVSEDTNSEDSGSSTTKTTVACSVQCNRHGAKSMGDRQCVESTSGTIQVGDIFKHQPIGRHDNLYVTETVLPIHNPIMIQNDNDLWWSMRPCTTAPFQFFNSQSADVDDCDPLIAI